MSIFEGDRVIVEDIPGVHTVLKALTPSIQSICIRLAPGTICGRWHGGDTLAVPVNRCRVLHVFVPDDEDEL